MSEPEKRETFFYNGKEYEVIFRSENNRTGKKHIAYTDPKASYRDHPRMCISSYTEGENGLILTEPDEAEKRSVIHDILDSILFDPDDFE